ncbi:E3 ubiquitin-protein ligase MARCHF9-like [Neosynchiropus ocellatus]
MFKYRIRVFFNELKVLLLMRTGTSGRTEPGTEPGSSGRELGVGGCGWPPLSCSQSDDDEEYYGSESRPRSLAFEDKESYQRSLEAASLPSLADSGTRSPQCRICFQGPEKGELLSPCRCAGSVRCSHQSCLIRWISERGSWSCELCLFKYQVLAISTKNPLQWRTISLTVIERVQIAAIILGSLFLLASISWLVWSSLSPSAKWQRQDLLFQICYGMYGFMDVVCLGLIVHEGSSVYRIFKRWQAVNQQWKVLNYDKSKDFGDTLGSRGKSVEERNSPRVAMNVDRNMSRHVRTFLNQHCAYTILHILSQLRTNNLHSNNSEMVMRVTTV